jgi:hypothetical protein
MIQKEKIIERIDKIERDLCSALDRDVYIPVKRKLEKVNVTYSLGMRKEDFKMTIHNQLEELKQEIEK